MMKGLKELLNFSDKKNTELIKRKVIKGTPFVIITTDAETFVTLGKYRLSERMESVEQAEKYINAKGWMLILSLIDIMVQEGIKLHEHEKEIVKFAAENGVDESIAKTVVDDYYKKGGENGNN